MSIFDKLQQRGIEMSDVFGAFLKAMADLDAEDGKEEKEDEESDKDETEDDRMDALSRDPRRGIYDPDFYEEEFPGRMYFESEEIDPESEEFYQGKEIGIPKEEAVHSDYDQNKLLAMSNGLFYRGF